MFVKVCGVRLPDQIDAAVELGYNAVGIVLHEKSPRFCEPVYARYLIEYAGSRIKTVAVGCTFSEVSDAADMSDYIQLYEEKVEYSDRLIYSDVNPPEGKMFRHFLYDSSRGSGSFSEPPGWLSGYRDNLIISGGLNTGNVSEVIKRFRPFGVDVSSGVERDKGVKDIQMMKRFIEEVRDAAC